MRLGGYNSIMQNLRYGNVIREFKDTLNSSIMPKNQKKNQQDPQINGVLKVFEVLEVWDPTYM